MFNIDKYLPMLQGGLGKMEQWLGHIYTEVKGTREQAERQARAADFANGVVDVAVSERVAPRSLTSLPVIVEKVVAKHEVVKLDELNNSRAVYQGQYRNIGKHAFFVTLVGVTGASSARHTLAPGDSLPIVTLLSQIVVDPIDGPANFQVFAY